MEKIVKELNILHHKCSVIIKTLNRKFYNIKLGEQMAKPIRCTPELRGEYAVNFIKSVFKNEKTKARKKDIELAKAIEKFSLSH